MRGIVYCICIMLVSLSLAQMAEAQSDSYRTIGNGRLETVALNPITDLLAIVYAMQLVVMDGDGNELYIQRHETSRNRNNGEVGWSADGTRLAHWGRGYGLRIWEVESRETHKVFGYREGNLVHISWYDEDQLLIVWSSGIVEIWNIDTSTVEIVREVVDEDLREEIVSNTVFTEYIGFIETGVVRWASRQPGADVVLLFLQTVMVRWDMETDVISYVHSPDYDSFFGNPRWCEDHIHILIYGTSNYPTIYNTETGERIYAEDRDDEIGPPLISGCVEQIMFKHQSRVSQGEFMFWDMKTQTETIIPFEIRYKRYQFAGARQENNLKIYLKSLQDIVILDLETQEVEMLTDDFLTGIVGKIGWASTSQHIAVQTLDEMVIIDPSGEIVFDYDQSLVEFFWTTEIELLLINHDGILMLNIDTQSLEVLYTFDDDFTWVMHAIYLPMEDVILLINPEDEIYEFDLRTNKTRLLWVYEKPYELDQIYGISISPDEEKILLLTGDRIIVWNRDFTEILFETGRDPRSGEFTTTWREDSEVFWFMDGVEDIEINLINGQQEQECMISIATFPEWVACRDMSINYQNQVAILYYDLGGTFGSEIIVRDGFSDNSAITLIALPYNAPRDLEWSPDGEFLAVLDQRGFVILIPRSEIEARLAEDVTSE